MTSPHRGHTHGISTSDLTVSRVKTKIALKRKTMHPLMGTLNTPVYQNTTITHGENKTKFQQCKGLGLGGNIFSNEILSAVLCGHDN